MSRPLTLRVPVDARFRELGPDAAGKYAEVAGGTAADGAAVAAAVTEEIARISAGAPDEAGIELEFGAAGSDLAIKISCEGRTARVQQPLPARRA